MKITLRDLPKISLNKWYASEHWSKRKRIKDSYIWIIKSQFKNVFSDNKQYEVSYLFFFKGVPLDASNCVAMVKMIEDIIFKDDNWKIVKKITISSEKSKDERVEIIINELN